MKIRITLEASEKTSSETVDIADLGYTENEWDLLPDNQKQNALQEYVLNLKSQPFWVLDSFEE